MVNRFFGKFKYGTVLFWSFAAKGAAFFLFYAFQIYLARKTGPEVYGQWNVFYSVFVILAIVSNCGLNYSSRRYVARYHGQKRLPKVVASVAKLRLFTSLFFMCVWFFLSGPMAALINRPDLAVYIAASAPMLFLTGLNEFAKEIFIGTKKIKNNFLINFSEYGFKLVLTVVLLRSFSGIMPVIWAFSMALVVTVILGFLLCRSEFSPFPSETSVTFMKAAAVYAMPLLVYEICNTVMSEVDTVVLGALRSNYDVGIYSMAKQMVIKAPHLAVAVGMGIMPAFAKLENANKDELRKLFVALLKVNAWMAGAAAVIIVVFAGPIMSLLFGEHGRLAAPSLRILSVYLVGSLFAVYFSYFLQYTGHAAKLAFNMCVAIAADLALMFWLVPFMGAEGAAISISSAYVVFMLLNFLDARKIIL
jgi:O-antigen/teichoic acid export membrane protein